MSAISIAAAIGSAPLRGAPRRRSWLRQRGHSWTRKGVALGCDLTTQLRGSDIEDRNGLYVMKLTPAAGTMKSREIRVVPLHEHIIAQGFIEMVQRVGKSALFYNDSTPQRVSADPLNPSRDRADTARAHLGTWVRGLGVD